VLFKGCGVMKKYNIIYADPPWRYNDSHCSGACEKHYNTMSINDLCNLPIKEIAADDCILFIWATYPLLPEAIKLIEAWGFKYKTIGFQWIKTNKNTTNPLFFRLNNLFFGLGRWTRGNTEPCLIATKGKIKRLNNSISQIVLSPRENHSKKPDIVREKIVSLVGDLPRIELFARKKTDGWDVFGNEVESDVRL
jgi:N6-adenosine-specific RNA methylase IME4